MSIYQAIDIATPASVAKGAPSDVGDLRDKSVVLLGSLTGTYVLQGAVGGDGTVDAEFFNISNGSLTAASLVAVPNGIRWVRWNCTAHSAGTPSSRCGGITP